jgi:AAA+ superfamily predicted ATPase
MGFEQELALHLRARSPLVVVITPEEERALAAVKSVCSTCGYDCLSWDCADGFQTLLGNLSPKAADPKTALEQIDKAEGQAVFVLKDFHRWWTNDVINRQLRSVAQRLKYTKKTLVVTTPAATLPPELRDEAVLLDLPSPEIAQLGTVLDRLVQNPGVKVTLTGLGREKLLQAALGMTEAQAQRVFAKAIVRDGSLDDRDIAIVTEEKRQIIRESGALEFYAVTETLADVGGLGVLKKWLSLRERAFSQEAREYGLPAPKGVALIGIPGTGKSLTAKMVAGLWRLPLLRLDIGALFGSLVGESEERARQALQLAETVAPCVLWIDEIEKGLAHGGLDGGTATRVFGTILTWMQEKTTPCFVVATANDVAALPPELLRKGRFDEIFFLDLPTAEERREILTVHLAKRQRIPADYDVEGLARRSEGYVGAEIEQAIVDAMYVAFNEHREFATQDVAAAFGRQVPLSVSQREVIGALREWLREGRAQSASFAEAAQAEEQFVPLEIAPAASGAPALDLPGLTPAS